MSKHSEAVDKVAKVLYYEILEQNRKSYEREGSIYYEFMDELKKLGFDFEDKNSIQANNLCQENPIETRDLVVKYYKKATLREEKWELMSNLHNKLNKELIPFFIEEFYKVDAYLMVVVGNCLKITANKNYIDEYVKMLEDKRTLNNLDNYGLAYLINTVSKFRSEKIKFSLIKLLEIEEPRYLVLKVLSKYKDSSLKPIFEKYLNDANKDIKKMASIAIEMLEK